MDHESSPSFDLLWKTKRTFLCQILLLITWKIDLPVHLKPDVFNHGFLWYCQPNQKDSEGDMILVGDAMTSSTTAQYSTDRC